MRIARCYLLAMRLRDKKFSSNKPDPYWRASRLATRILLKAQRGKKLSARDIRIGSFLANDTGVEDRLIEQSISYLTAPNKTHV